jgi:hypothetical protein
MQKWRRESDEVATDVADGDVSRTLYAQALPRKERYQRTTSKRHIADGEKK